MRTFIMKSYRLIHVKGRKREEKAYFKLFIVYYSRIEASNEYALSKTELYAQYNFTQSITLCLNR